MEAPYHGAGAGPRVPGPAAAPARRYRAALFCLRGATSDSARPSRELRDRAQLSCRLPPNQPNRARGHRPAWSCSCEKKRVCVLATALCLGKLAAGQLAPSSRQLALSASSTRHIQLQHGGGRASHAAAPGSGRRCERQRWGRMRDRVIDYKTK